MISLESTQQWQLMVIPLIALSMFYNQKALLASGEGDLGNIMCQSSLGCTCPTGRQRNLSLGTSTCQFSLHFSSK